MRRLASAATAFAALLLLAGCESEAPRPTAPDAGATPEAKRASGTGVVTAIDRSAGTITLDHREVPELGWPAMSMTFAAPPALLSGVAPGDTVAFDVTAGAGLPRITALEKR